MLMSVRVSTRPLLAAALPCSTLHIYLPLCPHCLGRAGPGHAPLEPSALFSPLFGRIDVITTVASLARFDLYHKICWGQNVAITTLEIVAKTLKIEIQLNKYLMFIGNAFITCHFDRKERYINISTIVTNMISCDDTGVSPSVPNLVPALHPMFGQRQCPHLSTIYLTIPSS